MPNISKPNQDQSITGTLLTPYHLNSSSWSLSEDGDSFSDIDFDKIIKENEKNNKTKSIHEEMTQNVFESNEENILDHAMYVYDYINKVVGIE